MMTCETFSDIGAGEYGLTASVIQRLVKYFNRFSDAIHTVAAASSQLSAGWLCYCCK